MKSDDIYEVVTALTGKIAPVGESSADEIRLENANKFIEVLDMMYITIDEIARRHKDSPYASEKRIGKLCAAKINSLSSMDNQ